MAAISAAFLLLLILPPALLLAETKTEEIKKSGKAKISAAAEKIVVDCDECPAPISQNAPAGIHYGTVTVHLKSLGTELSGFSVSLIRRSDGEALKTRDTDIDGAAAFYGVPAGEYLALLHRTGARLKPNLTTMIGDIIIKFSEPVPAAKIEAPQEKEAE